jgi:hypothetical protein
MKHFNMAHRTSASLIAIVVGFAVSVSAWAWNPLDWTTISVTTYYSDATMINMVGVQFVGECPYVAAPFVGEQTPYSQSSWVLCRDVNQVELPF